MTSLLVVGGFAPQGQAEKFEDYLKNYKQIRKDTKDNVLRPVEEAALVATAFAGYLLQHIPLPRIGQATIDGQYPSIGVSPGTVVTLRFTFIDPNTRSPVAGSDVGSVQYFVDETADAVDDFSLLGTSSDPSNGFALAYSVGADEPLVEAVPYDTGGSPIVIPGVAGQNVAVGLAIALLPSPVPALGMWSQVALGAALLVAGVVLIRRLLISS